jgi:hypothetical protein
MGFIHTSILGAHSRSNLLCGQAAGRFHHCTFPVDSPRLDWMQPGAFARQPTPRDTFATPGLLDVAIA